MQNGKNCRAIELGAMRIPTLIFIGCELALFPCIQLTNGGVSGFFSYLSIALVAAFSLFTLGGKRKSHFIRLGILLTLVADYYLVLCTDKYLEGVVSFVFVQMAYFAYTVLAEDRTSYRYANLFTRLCLSGLLVVVAYAVLGEDTDTLSVVSVIYYANLVVNMLFAFLLGRGGRLFAIGLALFAMCDLTVGMENLTSLYLDSDVFSFFYGDYINLPWIFYQPSQVLIGLSTLNAIHSPKE